MGPLAKPKGRARAHGCVDPVSWVLSPPALKNWCPYNSIDVACFVQLSRVGAAQSKAHRSSKQT